MSADRSCRPLRRCRYPDWLSSLTNAYAVAAVSSIREGSLPIADQIAGQKIS
jgi:hypothetical protein